MEKIRGIENWLKQCEKLGKSWNKDNDGAIVFRPKTIKEAEAIVDYMFSNYSHIKVAVESKGKLWTNIRKGDLDANISNNN